MAAKLEVIITEYSERMEFDVKGGGERTPREDTHLVAMIAAIKALVSDFDKRSEECNCASCKASRERKAEYERQNIH
ncbi:hypothetical protein [Pantoea sp. BAV 3049]|uniref:hypothetical protein n=1 Tax=Pantoea sp. BAV 3049 TaxID=2654188 RepID=UPI00131E8A62|nr:hypothetical protein [Pantoea sp. BAV 3049]